jgi:hypothetical protein
VEVIIPATQRSSSTKFNILRETLLCILRVKVHAGEDSASRSASASRSKFLQRFRQCLWEL